MTYDRQKQDKVSRDDGRALKSTEPDPTRLEAAGTGSDRKDGTT